MQLIIFVVFVSVWTFPAVITGASGVKVVVEEGSDAVLPCSLSSKESAIAKIFDWRKDESRQEVFFYDSGNHYNNGRRSGQDEQFRGRVSHYEDQVMNGNASIKIHNTKVTDSGIYSCIFPHLHPRQTSYIELVVERLVRDRSGETTGELHVSCQNRALTAGGGDLILQWQVDPRVDLSAHTVDVKRPDLQHEGRPRVRDVVHAYRHQQDFLTDQMDQYKGRTTLSHEDLKKGTITLRISSVDPSDSGRYKIFVPQLKAGCLVDVTVVKEEQQNRTSTSTSGPPVEDAPDAAETEALRTRRSHIPSVCAAAAAAAVVLVLVLVKCLKTQFHKKKEAEMTTDDFEVETVKNQTTEEV